MARVVAFDEVKHTRTQRVVDGNKTAWRTNYMQPSDEEPAQPQAFLAECGPQRVLRTHFHENDQFQVFVSGDGHAGKHPIKPFQVHFARAHTPYGPIVANDAGVGFLTLRAHKDQGAQYLPENREKLVNVEGRKPWQLTAAVDFPEAAGPIAIKPLEGMHDEFGLAGYSLTMRPNETGLAPDAANSNGQYIVVLGGSVVTEGAERKATTIIWVGPTEGRFKLQAGPEGLQAIALNFPKYNVRAEDGEAESKHEQGEFKVWQCVLCAFVYDEAEGLPEEGIAPGTRWADVPEDWGCPDCSARKADFEMVEI